MSAWRPRPLPGVRPEGADAPRHVPFTIEWRAPASHLAARPLRHRRPGPRGAPRSSTSWPRARQTLWQVLPLGPTGYGDSPYQCFSAFAGNPLLISLDALVERRPALPRMTSTARRGFPETPSTTAAVDRRSSCRCSSRRCRTLRRPAPTSRSARPSSVPPRAGGLARRLRAVHGGQGSARRRSLDGLGRGRSPRREPAALARWRQRTRASAVGHREFAQYLFFMQWRALRERCHARGIALMGDMPIFVAHDSADVWAHPELFQLARGRTARRWWPACRRTTSAPPASSGATRSTAGTRMERDGLRLVDRALPRRRWPWSTCVRLDHFRGFEAYWEVPRGRNDGDQRAAG